MKVETLGELVNWCSAIHGRLADSMTRGAERCSDEPTRWLMEYVAKHEAQMMQQMDGIEEEADPKALKTWVYDWLDHPPPKPDAVTGEADRQQAFEAVARKVFDAHNEIMMILQSLTTRADIPEAKELIDRMLNLEEGHTRQMSLQMHRIRDM